MSSKGAVANAESSDSEEGTMDLRCVLLSTTLMRPLIGNGSTVQDLLYMANVCRTEIEAWKEEADMTH